MTRAILCDIEGTIGSISFVRDVLFPYAAEHLPDFVRNYREAPAVAAQLDEVARIGLVERDDTEALIRKLLHWIEQDRKETPLKALQGGVWIKGYEAGAYQGHVYPDAFRKLTEWKQRGLGLHIYSSGSVKAQKLYFRYSDQGDMRLLFTGWFDTRTGPKQAKTSYATIASMLQLEAGEILFLSDSPGELDAAKGAGMRTTWLIRPEDSDHDPLRVQSSHPVAVSFDEIRP